MLFNSPTFLLCFLPAAVCLYAAVGERPGARMSVLLGLSLVFYGCWDWRFLPVLVGGIVVNWLAAEQFRRSGRVSVIRAAIAADLLLLGVFKYADFAWVGAGGEPIGLAIPLGISFFTFHHIMYLMDLRRLRAVPAPLGRYALYISFFPQAIAGPLARWSEVGAQFGRPMFGPDWERRWRLGLTLIVWGLVEKVALGDPIGRLLDPIYAAAAAGVPTDGSAWLAPGFALQIFFDFSGYSDVAIGTALLFAVELPINFDGPFRAASILGLWQRWHMTLTRFLRDYVFMALADLRIAGRRHTVAQYVFAIIATMGLCGLWHGAGWTFVLWGLLQGAAMVFALGWRRRIGRPPRLVGWAATAGFFVLSAVLFRAGSLGDAGRLYAGLATAPEWHALRAAWPIGLAAMLAVALPPSMALCGAVADIRTRAVPVALALAAVVILVQVGGSESYAFLYFQF